MSIHLTVPPKKELKPRIVVFGVGGAGGNAVNNMVAAGLEGCDFVVANTDAQALTNSSADRRIQIGSKLTEGLGAGSNPEVGKAAAEETMAEIVDMLQGAHMAFVTAGMGGGTGTGAAPVIARAAREQGILTVGVVTKPFDFEGGRRMKAAEAGIEELAREVDTLIIIPNQNLFRIANAQTTFAEAFALADEVLHSGVAGITDLMIKPGLINLDFADVRTVMNEMGKAMMGTGEAEGEKRAIEAAEAAIANPLLDDVSMQGARGVLINITGGDDMTLYELDEAANRIRQEVDPEANIIVGSTFDEALRGLMRVSVVATGIEAETAKLRALDGGRVIPMTSTDEAGLIATPTAGDLPPVEEISAADMQIGRPGSTSATSASNAPTSEAAPMAEAAPQAADVAASQAQADNADLPGFLAGQKAQRPNVSPIPARKRSFIDRVFGGKKGNEPEQSAAAATTPRMEVSDTAPTEAENMTPAEETPKVEAPIVEAPKVVAEEAPLEVAETTETAPRIEPAAFGEELDGVRAKPAQPAQSGVATAELEAPQTEMEATEAPIEEAPVEAKAEAAVEEKAEEKVEAPKVSAPQEPVTSPSVDAVAQAAPVQTTMQTTMQTGPTMSGGSYDQDQLDIPAFLRR